MKIALRQDGVYPSLFNCCQATHHSAGLVRSSLAEYNAVFLTSGSQNGVCFTLPLKDKDDGGDFIGGNTVSFAAESLAQIDYDGDSANHHLEK